MQNGMPWQHTRHSTHSAPDGNRRKNVGNLKVFSGLQRCSLWSRQTEGTQWQCRCSAPASVPETGRHMHGASQISVRQPPGTDGYRFRGNRSTSEGGGGRTGFLRVLRPQCCSTWTHKAAALVQVPQQPLHGAVQDGEVIVSGRNWDRIGSGKSLQGRVHIGDPLLPGCMWPAACAHQEVPLRDPTASCTHKYREQINS